MGEGFMTLTHHVRLARPDDRPRIQALIAELLPEVDPRKRWDWIYAGNPHGPALTWIAIDDASGEAAGCTSFFRRRLLVDGRETAGALGGDGFVHPKFRRRGIGGAMHRASAAGMADAGIEVMFGTPMPANATPLAGAGARDVTNTVRYVRVLDAHALHLPGLLGDLATPFVAPLPTRARLEPMLPNDARVDELWRETAPELGIATVRNAQFFTWRYLDSPSRRQHAFVVMHRHEPIGAVALEIIGRRLRLVDVLAPATAWPRVLRAVGSFGRGLDSIEFKTTERNSRQYQLWRHGWVGRDTKPLNILLPPGEPNAQVYYDANRWYFTWAESDLDFAL
jgi:GNAT superfamily N-acetyltransferase